MRNMNIDLFNHLKQTELSIIRCWKIVKQDGSIIGFTEYDQPLTIDGVYYDPTNSFNASAIVSKNDLSVDNLSVVALSSELITEPDMLNGVYDKARVYIFAVCPDAIQLGTIPLRVGTFGDLTFKDGKFETELRTLSQLLQQRIGRIYGLECDAQLGDTRCKVNLAPLTVTGSIFGVLGDGVYYLRDRTEAANWFQYGEFTFTSGANVGFTVEISGYSAAPNIVYLFEPPPYAAQDGDTYSMVAGCDKTTPTCSTKYNNIINHRGFPLMPTEHQVLNTPNAK